MAAGRGQRDLTRGPIGWTLLAFAFPTFVSTVLQSLNGSVNAVWIGRTLGEEALAATSNANLVMFLLAAFVFGFGMAATVLVGQAFGRGDVIEARRVVGTAIGGFMPLAIAIGVIGWLGAPALLHLLSTPPEALPLAVAYLRVVFVALPAVLVIIVLMMALRGSGDAMTPLWFMLLVVFLDSALNPVFILGLGPAPELGIAGSATATVIANYLGLAGLLFYIYRRDLPLRLRGAELRFLRADPACSESFSGRACRWGCRWSSFPPRRWRPWGWSIARASTPPPPSVSSCSCGPISRCRRWRSVPRSAPWRRRISGRQVGPGRRGDSRRHRLQFPYHSAAARPAPAGRPAGPGPIPGRRQPGAAARPACPAARFVELPAVRRNSRDLRHGARQRRGDRAAAHPVVALYPIRLGFAIGFYPWLGPDALWLSFPFSSFAIMLMAIAFISTAVGSAPAWGRSIRSRRSRRRQCDASPAAGSIRPASLGGHNDLDRAPGDGSHHRRLRQHLTVDRDALARAGLDAQLGAVKLFGDGVAGGELPISGEPVPDQPQRAAARHHLDDDLAAADVGLLDQLDPAVESAVGDPHLGRPQGPALAAVIDGDPERTEAGEAVDRPDQVADPAEPALEIVGYPLTESSATGPSPRSFAK
jgi:hypothetical protein